MTTKCDDCHGYGTLSDCPACHGTGWKPIPAPTKNQYVLGFLFDRASHALLIRKVKPEWQRGLLNGLGGHIEPGETPREAMRREFCEETGPHAIEIDSWQQFAIIEGDHFQMHCFRAWSDDINLVHYDREGFVSRWKVPLEDDAMCVPNLRWLIPMALHCPLDYRDFPYHIRAASHTALHESDI